MFINVSPYHERDRQPVRARAGTAARSVVNLIEPTKLYKKKKGTPPCRACFLGVCAPAVLAPKAPESTDNGALAIMPQATTEMRAGWSTATAIMTEALMAAAAAAAVAANTKPPTQKKTATATGHTTVPIATDCQARTWS